MDGTSWDEEILQDLFDNREQRLIKQIPVNTDQTTDFIFWCKEPTGLFTVKSAYHALQELKGLTNDVDASVFWKILWSLKLPPKIKNLMWRAGSSCLPTLAQLASKFVPVNTRCPLCDEFDETISHVLLTCRAIKQVWERVAIVVSAKSYLDQWQNAQKTQIETSWTTLQSYDGVEHWIKPEVNIIKINVDASIFEGQNRFGGAFVVRDHNGLLVEGRTKLYIGNMVPAVVEALSFREALSWIKDHSTNPVWVETDCLLVVQALRSSISLASYFGSVIQECKALLASLRNVDFCFVKRSANKVAHEFARASLLYPDCIFSMENIPTDLLPMLVTEFEG
ncbi:hypothetical protein CsatA_014250 [Cannabis sativa]